MRNLFFIVLLLFAAFNISAQARETETENTITLRNVLKDGPIIKTAPPEKEHYNIHRPFFFAMGIGVSATTLDVGNASPVGLFVDFDILGFHFDFASNYATGEGEYLDFSSSYTKKSNKIAWYTFNGGYNIPVKNWFVATPKAGVVAIRNIWEDPIGWDTYYETPGGTKFQIGIDLKKRVNQLYIKLGTSTTEVFSLGMGFIII